MDAGFNRGTPSDVPIEHDGNINCIHISHIVQRSGLILKIEPTVGVPLINEGGNDVKRSCKRGQIDFSDTESTRTREPFFLVAKIAQGTHQVGPLLAVVETSIVTRFV